MNGHQTVAAKDIQDFLDECRELFKDQVNGLARIGDKALRVRFKRKYVEFGSGSEVFFFNAGRSALGKESKQSRSPNYFYISDSQKQLTVRVRGDGKVALALATYDGQKRTIG